MRMVLLHLLDFHNAWWAFLAYLTFFFTSASDFLCLIEDYLRDVM